MYKVKRFTLLTTLIFELETIHFQESRQVERLSFDYSRVLEGRLNQITENQ